MKQQFAALIFALFALPALAEEEKMPWLFLDELADNITHANVAVLHSDTTKFVDTPLVSTWQLGQVDIQVYLSKLHKMKEAAQKKPLPLEIQNPSESYKGITIQLVDVKGKVFEKVRFYQGAVYDKHGGKIYDDPNREFEYWMFSTNAEVPGSRLLAWQMLPIISYSQCITLKNPIVWTTPPQCLLPNDEIFLGLEGYIYADVPVEPTQEALSIKNFDDCLKRGHALINTFPRQCVAAGGHVYKEPPRLPEAPETPRLEATKP